MECMYNMYMYIMNVVHCTVYELMFVYIHVYHTYMYMYSTGHKKLE